MKLKRVPSIASGSIFSIHLTSKRNEKLLNVTGTEPRPPCRVSTTLHNNVAYETQIIILCYKTLRIHFSEETGEN